MNIERLARMIDDANENLKFVGLHDPMQGFVLDHDLNVAIESLNPTAIMTVAHCIDTAHRAARQ